MAANAITHAGGYNRAIKGETMPLVPCRACGHTVDTSAEACPGCGATNPGRKLSRQQHDLIVLLIQLVIGIGVLFIAGNMAWNAVGPIIKQQMAKPVNG